MTLEQKIEADEKASLEEFTAYFVQNYPGPHTIISDPKWHAPKIFRAAQRALLRTLAAAVREKAIAVMPAEMYDMKEPPIELTNEEASAYMSGWNGYLEAALRALKERKI